MIWKYLHQEKISGRIKFFNLADKSWQELVIGSWNQIMSNGKRSGGCSWGSLQSFEQVTEESDGLKAMWCCPVRSDLLQKMWSNSPVSYRIRWWNYRVKFSASCSAEGQIGDHSGPCKVHCLFEGESLTGDALQCPLLCTIVCLPNLPCSSINLPSSPSAMTLFSFHSWAATLKKFCTFLYSSSFEHYSEMNIVKAPYKSNRVFFV